MTTSTTPERPRAVLLAVQLPDASDDEFASSLGELERLAKTLGLEVVGRVTQKRSHLATGTVVGGGKLAELARWTGGKGVVPVGPPVPRRRADRESAQEPEPEDDETQDADASAADDASLPAAQRASVVLIDHDVTPTQTRNLERATEAEVLDRTAVILAIFQRHARSREARLQVEIA
ncbi:MAG: GTPase HflX, partial [Myxococcota bacterium]|nr:GTPase HflX [Myxococcota bacterium]